MTVSTAVNDLFELHILRVEVEKSADKPLVCSHVVGAAFEVHGENIIGPNDTTFVFSLYALASLLPLLPAKQRNTHPHDWMSTDALIACPDPNCGGLFRITRIGKEQYSHAETTVVPLL